MERLKVYYNSHKTEYKSPFGALPSGRNIRFRIRIDKGALGRDLESKCYLCIWDTHNTKKLVPMNRAKTKQWDHDPRIYEAIYQTPKTPGLLWYYFKLNVGEQTLYYGNNKEALGGQGMLYTHEPPGYQITVYTPWETPKWYKEGIMYQIFVDRFHRGGNDPVDLKGKESALYHMDWYDTPFYIRDGDGSISRWTFFGGNLRGIIEKLDYLRELGVSIIYLNPIFEAPSNHKYDTGDYMTIDPMFGDEKVFQELVLEAEKRGIAVILDGVFSHTGADSIYFNKNDRYPGLGAYQSKESPYYKWYRFEIHPHKYESWWGVDVMPNVDEMEPTYREFIYGGDNSVIKHWMKMGVRGWRLDVVDELPDEFIKGLRGAVKSMDDEGILLGEVWEDASNKISYGKLRRYLWGEELDSTTNYPLRSIWLGFILGQIDAKETHTKIMSLYENYPKESFYSAMNLIGGHDRIRILTRLGEAPKGDNLTEREKEGFRLNPKAKELGIKRLKLITLMQFFFPGVPCIYYGDEAGLEGYSDPYNRGTYPWGREDKEILNWYKTLSSIRQEHDVLKEGEFESFYPGKDVYGFRRSLPNEQILVIINRSINEHWEGRPGFSIHRKDNLAKKVCSITNLLGPKNKLDDITNGQLRLAPLSAMAVHIVHL